MRHRSLALCLTTIAALSCASGGSTRAEDSAAVRSDGGVLVGLVSGEDEVVLTTLLVGWRDGTPRLLGRAAPLMVPRADGWWRVGVETGCIVDEGGSDYVEAQPFVFLEQATWTARAGDTARVQPVGGPCREAEREMLRQQDSVFAARNATDTTGRYAPDTTDEGRHRRAERLLPGADNVDLYCGVETERPTFVSAQAIAVEMRSRSTEFCNPAKYYTSGGNAAWRFGTREQLPLVAALGQRMRDSLVAAYAASDDCAFDETGETVDSSWTVRRQRGAWRAFVWLDGPIVCRGGSEGEDGTPVLPAWSGDTPLPMPWDSIAKQLGGYPDQIAASPSGRWMVVTGGDTLEVRAVHAGTIGRPVLRVPVARGWTRMVMLRWASDAEVERWRREMRRVPPAVVQFVADSTSP